MVVKIKNKPKSGGKIKKQSKKWWSKSRNKAKSGGKIKNKRKSGGRSAKTKVKMTTF